MFMHNRLVLFGVFTAAGMLSLPSCQFLPASLSGGRSTPTSSSPRGGSGGGSSSGGSDVSSSSGGPTAANSGKRGGSRGRGGSKEEKYTSEQKNAARKKYQEMVQKYNSHDKKYIDWIGQWLDKPGYGCSSGANQQSTADIFKKVEEANYLEDFAKACAAEFEPMLSEYDSRKCRNVKQSIKEVFKNHANACVAEFMKGPVKVIEDHISGFKGGQGKIGWQAIDHYYDTSKLLETARENVAPILPWTDGGELDTTLLEEAHEKLKKEIADWKADGNGLHTQWASWWGKGAKAPGALALAKKYAKTLKISGKKVKLKKVQLAKEWVMWREAGIPKSQTLQVFMLVELPDFPRPLVVRVDAYKEHLGGGKWSKDKLEESPAYILGEK